MPLTDREERTAFTVLVLSGIWLIARAASLGKMPHDGHIWRSHAVGHMDLIGQQTDEAKEYRREITFPTFR